MANLKNSEKLKLEKYLEMKMGYVCDFSNRTFADFVLEHTGVDVYSEKYFGSKANRLRAFWDTESNYVVAKLLGGKATINRDTATLSSCLFRAKKMRLISRNPCGDVGKLNERHDRRQARPLSYEEEDRIKQFSPPLLRMLITLLAETGLRVKKEALPLRWADVSLDSEPACIHVVGSKSPAGLRPIWLTTHCRDALLQWRELFGPEISPFVFPSRRNPHVHFVDYKTAWRTAAKKAGLADRRIYDLRSTFASRANMCHATALTVAHLLGHASTQILPTYVRPLDENTRALIEALDVARKKQPTVPTVN